MFNSKIKRFKDPSLELCVNKKLELLLSSASNQELGGKLFNKKQLELAPFKAVDFADWSNWEQDPLKNRSWQWRLNWLSFLSYLMAYHRSSGDNAVLSFASEAIRSWLDAYLKSDTSYPFEFIWHDHATALRAEQLVFFTYYCRIHAPEWAEQQSEFLEYIEYALEVHGQWLAKDSFYSEHTNHGLEQARVLLLLGTVFDGEQAKEWQQLAISRISSELAFSFTDEGVHKENSPAYHIFVFKVFIGIIKDYPASVLGDLAEQFSQFSAKALSFITHILRPDGKLPPIGDTEQLPTSDAYRDMFGHRPEYQYFLYALTQGKQGVPSPYLNRVYAKSGYAVFRDHWPAREHFHKAFHIIAKVGCSSRYHHQQDEGHISLYAGGEDWLIDSGLYNYINKDPVRRYMRGRPGHNVPVITHASYNQEFEHRLEAWKVTKHSEDEVHPHLNMLINVLQPVEHARCVDFDAQKKVVTVTDKVSASDQQLRNVTLQWHFPKDKEIKVDGRKVLVSSPKGNQLSITFEGVSPDNLSLIKGRKEDRVFSCISYKANQLEDSQLLRVTFQDCNELDVTTRFEFELAEHNIAHPPQSQLCSEHSLPELISNWPKEKHIAHSVVLGGSSSSMELAGLHREHGFGHTTLLANHEDECQALQPALNEHYLSTWLDCRIFKLASEPPMILDKSAIRGLEGIELLVINPSNINQAQLSSSLITMIPLLLKRMAKSGEVWINTTLPEEVKTLCKHWARQHGFKVTLVTNQ